MVGEVVGVNFLINISTIKLCLLQRHIILVCALRLCVLKDELRKCKRNAFVVVVYIFILLQKISI